MADKSKTPALEVLEPKLLRLTLDEQHLFAVWRALQCYADISLASAQQLGQSQVALLRSASEVQALVGQHMRRVLGYPLVDDADEHPDVYCQWGDGLQVYRDSKTSRFVCAACPFNQRSYDKMEGVGGVGFGGMVDRQDHVLETRHEMVLHLERHLREGHKFPREALDRLREEIERGGK